MALEPININENGTTSVLNVMVDSPKTTIEGSDDKNKASGSRHPMVVDSSKTTIEGSDGKKKASGSRQRQPMVVDSPKTTIEGSDGENKVSGSRQLIGFDSPKTIIEGSDGKNKASGSRQLMVVDSPKITIEGSDEKNKASGSRHPRWTRQESLILIQGKKIVENQFRRGRRSTVSSGSVQIEPKWDLVSSYCKMHDVNREPLQCRKRWSNLLGDFKKIKTWEEEKKEEAESYWMMRNDLRRERKLPGFFDSGVYDLLEGRELTAEAFPLALVTVMEEDAKKGNGKEAAVVEEEEDDEDDKEVAELVFESGKNAAAEDGLFSDSEQTEQQEEIEGLAEMEIIEINPTKTFVTPLPIPEKEKESDSNPWRGSMSEEGRKRRRLSCNGCHENRIGDRLVDVLERNGNMLNAQLEAQNLNRQLDREQQKEQTKSIVSVLNKFADAIGKIADKL